MKAKTSIRAIIISATRLKVIHQLFYFPRDISYVRQLVRSTGEEINAVRRELQNLKDANIICSENRGNRVYYWANLTGSLFEELLVIAHKTYGLGAKLSHNRKRLGKLKYVLYHRDFILNQDKKSDSVDIVFVGSPTLRLLDTLIKSEEEKRGREINYMVMEKDELLLRKTRRDPFIVDLFLSYPAVIIGNASNLAHLT